MSRTTTRSRRHLWTLVMRREIAVRLRDRVFIISTVTFGALLALVLAANFFWSQPSDDTTKVATVGSAAQEVLDMSGQPGEGLASSLAGLLEESELQAVQYSDADEARTAVEDEDVSAALVRNDNEWVVIVDDQGASSKIISQLASGVANYQLQTNMADAGTSMAELYAGTDLVVEDLRGEEVSDETHFKQAIAALLMFAFGLLFFFVLVMFGNTIAQSVVTEKESRIVDILAAAVPLRQILVGKVLGTSVLAALQMCVIAGITLIGVRFMNLPFDLPNLGTAILWFVPFFIGGFLAMGFVYATAGAMATRNEDLQATQLPLSMVAMVIYILPMPIAMQLLMGEDPNLVWLSYVPLLNTVFMPIRLFLDEAAWWEAMISMGITAAFGYVVLIVAAKLYKRSIMNTTGSLSWREVLAKVR